MDTVGWLVALAVFILIEVATLSLTTIWFAGGSLLACLISLFDVNLTVQFLVFVITSFVVLFLLRPSAVKYFNKSRTKTNIEGILGTEVLITEEVNNIAMTGVALVNGQEWSARAEQDDMILEKGTKAVVSNISGVKLILTKMN